MRLKLRRLSHTLFPALSVILVTIVSYWMLPVTAGANAAATVSVTLTPSTIVADGHSTTVASAAVTDAAGHPLSKQAVSFSSSDPGQPASIPASPSATSPGTYTATITSTTTVGLSTITATDTTAKVSGSAILTQTVGAPSQIAVTLTPAAIVADGHAKTVASAAITDAEGRPVAGQAVSFSSSDRGQPASIPGSASATSPGTYTATITSTTTVGPSTITATDAGAKLSGSAILAQTAGKATQMRVTLTPSAIVADGHSKTVAIAAVTDAEGHPVSGESVSFSSSDPGQPSSVLASPGGPGIYAATMTSTTTVGPSVITATDATAKISESAILIQTPGTGNHIALTLTPSTIVADGQSKTTAAARLVDAQGHPVSSDTVVFSASDGGVRFSSVATNNGTYTATLTSSTTPGAVTVTATDVSTDVSTGAVLNQVHGPASDVTVALTPLVVVANGISTSTATISVSDAHGNVIMGDRIKVSVSDNHVHVGPVVNYGFGMHTVVLTSSNVPRRVTVTATDVSEAPEVSGTATLTEVRAPSLVALARLHWSFYYTPRYTLVQMLALKGAPRGGMITINCQGRGCPRGTRKVTAPDHCAPNGKGRGCRATVTYDLARSLRGHRLSVGTQVVINVLQRGWIGKYYAFKIRSGRGPQLRISCLPPGGTSPGVGC